MKKTLLEIYALAVCFVTVVCFAVALGIGVYDVIQIISPEFTLDSYKFEQHQSNEAFLKARDCNKKDKTVFSEEDLTKKRIESYQIAIKMERRDGLQSLSRAIIIILIDIIIFLLHWRIARHARETASPSN